MKLTKEDMQSAKEKAAQLIRSLSSEQSLLKIEVRRLERQIDAKIASLFENVPDFTAKSFMQLATKDSKVIQTNRLKSLFLEDIYPKKFIFFENDEFSRAKTRATKLVREAIARGEDVLEEIQDYTRKQKRLVSVSNQLSSLQAVESLGKKGITSAEKRKIEAQLAATKPSGYTPSTRHDNVSDDNFYYYYYWMWRNNAAQEDTRATAYAEQSGSIPFYTSTEEQRSSSSDIRNCDISDGGSRSMENGADTLGSSRDFVCNTNDSYGSYS